MGPVLESREHGVNNHTQRIIDDSLICKPMPSAHDVEIEGGRLLSEVERFIAKYVVLPSPALLPMSLWAVATHIFDSFDAFPYVSLSSPTPRCGKTRTLEILELLVARPWRGTAPTEAALFRFIEDKQPTLLLDEVEGLAKRNASERDSAVLAILNAGYKSGQTVPRCVGNTHELQHFRVFCPKAFACIGRLPGALADRSIIIQMQRRRPGEHVDRFRLRRAKREAEPIQDEAVRAVKLLSDEIAEAYSKLPELSFLTDRDEEIFSPLFAVCAILAPDRVKDLQQCAKELCDAKASEAVEDSTALRLLHDVRDSWPAGETNCLTKTLLSKLKEIEDGSWQGDYELPPRRLAKMLRPFGIERRQVKTKFGEGKGYVMEEVELAISRYPCPEKETGKPPA